MRAIQWQLMAERLLISRIGFGCARIFNGIEQRQSAKLIEHAYSLGIRHFDTAPLYGDGTSEDVLGAVLAGVDDVTVATKVGIPRPASGPKLQSALKRMTVRRMLSYAPSLKRRLKLRRSNVELARNNQAPLPLDRDTILRAFEDSSKRLRRDRIDLYFVHEPDQFIIDQTTLAVFEGLKADGRIRAHGLAYGGLASSGYHDWDIVQSTYEAAAAPGNHRIYHGLLRSAGSDALADAIRAQQDAVFLVSVSEPHQLTNLLQTVRAAEYDA